MISDEDRLEDLEEVIDELITRSWTEAIIVEGPRDVKALRALGVNGTIKSINRGVSIINLCESLSVEHDKFIILTDWDRKGGQLAQLLRKGFVTVDAKYDDRLRKKISSLTKKDLKDIEGLPKYMERLRKSLAGSARAK
ncbi:MAG: toprim domain-containing protein [Thermoplasmata archaeon]|nr:toprim domain-containing protein [Thermoplasmata archaeon]